MHYARQGLVTPEMEFVAIRENGKREWVRTVALTADPRRREIRELPPEPPGETCALASTPPVDEIAVAGKEIDGLCQL